MSSYKMVPEVKAKLVAALRSGDYVQGTGALRAKKPISSDRFCCLGVLCDLAEKEGIVKSSLNDEVYAYDGREAFLPGSVREWSGLGREGQYGETHQERLVFQNDDERLTFPQIADLIEKRL